MSRIIAGSAGGRRLVMPPGELTRPTAERAREGLFSTLASMLGSLEGVAFLDLYAGSGAVGLEAASRGAARVLLVERALHALGAIRANLGALGLDGIELAAEPVERLLASQPSAPYDVVFLDPPYADPVEPVLQLLVDNAWLGPDAVVCVERSTRTEPPYWPLGLDTVRSRRYGEATLWYGRRP